MLQVYPMIWNCAKKTGVCKNSNFQVERLSENVQSLFNFHCVILKQPIINIFNTNGGVGYIKQVSKKCPSLITLNKLAKAFKIPPSNETYRFQIKKGNPSEKGCLEKTMVGGFRMKVD